MVNGGMLRNRMQFLLLVAIDDGIGAMLLAFRDVVSHWKAATFRVLQVSCQMEVGDAYGPEMTASFWTAKITFSDVRKSGETAYDTVQLGRRI